MVIFTTLNANVFYCFQSFYNVYLSSDCNSRVTVKNSKTEKVGPHAAWIRIWMTKRWGATSDNAFIFKKIKLKYKRENNFQRAVLEIIPFIHLDKHLDRARGTLWIKFTKNYSLPISNFMHGLKSAILAIFQKYGTF